jgi:uncharacterized protein YyaL (SSP411 family)
MPNRLAQEKSPYLRQHADNPVDWWPWGEAAFERARVEQKPIFLSIGYSTCHWCHVMAHESFENAEIAKILNADFIPIKVDREERPDVDKVYMSYVQASTGHGGWPLSAWLTPALKPFYGGTYFPPEDRHGRPGFPAVLRAIASGWANDREKMVAEGDRVIETLRAHFAAAKEGASAAATSPAELVSAASTAFEKGFQYFYEAFDANHGGFGGAPKFPRASNLNFLMRCAALQGVRSELGAEVLKMAGQTLRAMAQGGIHDHIGGGFHRYSVDEGWFVPHFEKMLYDQAQIAINALDARVATGDERYAWMARDIFAYVERELTSPGGGFYSAEDADSALAEDPSRHAEGAFYVWTAAELRPALGDDFSFFAAHFGIAENGNVPPPLDPQGEFTGKNILAQRQSLQETARSAGLEPEQANDRLLSALAKLRAIRAGRPRPHLDDKILTAWNGLMISALAQAQRILGEGAAAAVRAAEFIRRELYDEGRGRLYRSYREGRSDIEGFAEDYAFLVAGLLDLYEGTFEVRWLQWAERLQATMDALFWDAENGGYFNSAAGDPHIVLRLKEDYDGAEPAPSSVAAMNLLRLAAIFDPAAATSSESSYRGRGLRCLEALRGQWSRMPQALPQLLCALELALESPRHLVLAGDPSSDDFRALAAVVCEKLGPRRTLLALDGGDGSRWLGQRLPWLAEMRPIGGRAAAYLCEEFTCQAPVTTAEELRALLAR